MCETFSQFLLFASLTWLKAVRYLIFVTSTIIYSLTSCQGIPWGSVGGNYNLKNIRTAEQVFVKLFTPFKFRLNEITFHTAPSRGF